MKIAIYGDSHAANIYEKSMNDDVSYVEMLYRKYDLTNFGAPGSSLFYSYNQFSMTHQMFDKIIFLATSPGRIYLNPDQHPTIRPFLLHIASVDHAMVALENEDITSLEKKLFQMTCDYFLNIQNEEQERLFHNLMLKDIKRIRPDSLLIEVFEFSGNNDTDFNYWNTDQSPTDVYRHFHDIRHCHLSKEKHIILYEMIEENIHTGKDINYNRLLNIKPSKSFEDYFIDQFYFGLVSPERYNEVFK